MHIRVAAHLRAQIPATEGVDVAALVRTAQFLLRHRLVLHRGIVCHRTAPDAGSPGRMPAFVPYVPLAKRLDVLQSAHSDEAAGHPGIQGTYQYLRYRCFWPGLFDDVKAFVERCHACQLTRSRPSHHIPLLPLPVASHPFQIVGMDFLKLPKTKSGKQYVLVFTDYLTRWVECVATEKQDGETVAEALLKLVVVRHGLPTTLLSDQGKAFCEGVAAKLYEKLGIHKKATTPYHPQCNGLTERFNRTMVEMLSRWRADIEGKLLPGEGEWDEHLPLLLWAYRCHFHRDLRASPFYMLYGREPSVPVAATIDYHDPALARSRFDYIKSLMTRLPEVWNYAQNCLGDIAKRYSAINERQAHRIAEVLKVGDPVYVRILAAQKQVKGRPGWDGPYIVRRMLSAVNYELSSAAEPTKTFVIWVGHIRLARDVQANAADAAYAAAHPSQPLLLPHDADDMDEP
jgi:transposase InsO family protein